VLGGSVPLKTDVHIYDGAGRQAALSYGVQIASQGISVTIATPDEALAVDMPYPDKAGFRKRIAELGVRSLVDSRRVRVYRAADRLVALFRNEYS
jgi:hypothetical protein